MLSKKTKIVSQTSVHVVTAVCRETNISEPSTMHSVN